MADRLPVQLTKERHHGGFTLIELLVVIGIIALLASLLLPALHRGKVAALSAVCKSNLRQWGLGIRMYADDFNGYPLNWAIGRNSDETFWYARLQRYTGGRWPEFDVRTKAFEPRKNVTVCPSFSRLPTIFYNPYLGSYGYNGTGIGGFGLIRSTDISIDMLALLSTNPMIKENEIVNPASMIAMGDAIIMWVPLKTMGDYRLTPIYSWGDYGMWHEVGLPKWVGNVGDVLNLAALTKKRHGGRFNVLFCDGHVENLRPQELFDVRKDEVLKLWNRDNIPHSDLLPTYIQ